MKVKEGTEINEVTNKLQNKLNNCCAESWEQQNRKTLKTL